MNNNKAIIEKAIILLISFQVMVNLGFELYYYRLPYWIEEFRFPSMFQFTAVLLRLLTYISTGFILAGIIKLVEAKEIKLLKEFSFPIYLYTIKAIYFFLFCSLSTETSYFVLRENTPFYILLLRILSFISVILVLYYFVMLKTRNTEALNIPVKRSSRFFNRLIDLTIIFSFSFTTIESLSHRNILAHIPFFNSNTYWFFALNMIVYYFVLEFVFLQTIGKLHNNSFVSYERNRFKSILIRTFGRFIPFDAFSFFGTKGWHDGISETSVLVEDKQD